jgi:mRNA interferase MazF
MERFVKGDIVVVSFPFSDLSATKKRPAFVLACLQGNDVILCQITSQYVRDGNAIAIQDSDFVEGSLKQSNNIRPNRIFTAEIHIIDRKIGHMQPKIVEQVVNKLCEIIKS